MSPIVTRSPSASADLRHDLSRAELPNVAVTPSRQIMTMLVVAALFNASALKFGPETETPCDLTGAAVCMCGGRIPTKPEPRKQEQRTPRDNAVARRREDYLSEGEDCSAC